MLELLVQQLARREPERNHDAHRARAAVALVLVTDPDRLLLIRRAERAGDPWSGHLALPGGRFDAADSDLLATAVRETAEETGVILQRGSCRAELDDLAPNTPVLPPIMVRPFVFLLDSAPRAGVSNEVVQSSWLPLELLLADGVRGTHTIAIRGEPRSVPGYHLPEGFLWGMTERILTPVVDAWRELR